MHKEKNLIENFPNTSRDIEEITSYFQDYLIDFFIIVANANTPC